MADPRKKNGVFVGFDSLHQEATLRQIRESQEYHPLENGWKFSQFTDDGLAMYTRGEFTLVRGGHYGIEDAWLVFDGESEPMVYEGYTAREVTQILFDDMREAA
jgi:hypothetical protein